MFLFYANYPGSNHGGGGTYIFFLFLSEGGGGGGGGEGGCHSPLKFSPSFQDHFLADAVFSSCSLVLETRFGKVWSESVVKRYDVICSMKTSHFFK